MYASHPYQDNGCNLRPQNSEIKTGIKTKKKILNDLNIIILLNEKKLNTFPIDWPGSSVGIATDYELDGPGIESQ